MKLFVAFLLCLFASVDAFGQSWKDTLLAAQNDFQNKDYESAYERMLSAQRLAPSDVNLSRDLGTIAFRNKAFDAATQAFEGLSKQENQAEYWHNLALTYQEQNEINSAIEAYKNALKINPDLAESRYNLAQLLRNKKQQDSPQNEENKKDQNKEESDENEQSENQNNGDNSQKSQNQDNKESDREQQNDSMNQQDDNDNRTEEVQSKLSSKKMERLLEDLLKQEFETQRRLKARTKEGKEVEVKSGKRY